MDGILFDTERLYCEAWRAVFSETDYALSDELLFSCAGLNAKDTRAAVMAACGSEFPYEACADRVRDRIFEWMRESGPPEKPGVRALLDYLSARSIPVALATSTSEKSARWMMERSGLARYFSGWAFGSEVVRGKPEPDIFLLALERLGIKDSSSCVVFEDSPAGLTAAIEAGTKAVFVPDLVTPDREILAHVWKRIDSLEEAASDRFFSNM